MDSNLRLIVMRHAKSSWGHPGLEDHDRPLNGRGKRSASAVAHELERMGWAPDRVLSSDSKRTRETWAHMKDVLPDVTTTFHRSMYLGGIDQACLEVLSIEDSPSCILLLGHNPGWSHMVYELTGQPMGLKTADAALLEPRLNASWDELMTGSQTWTLSQLIRSRALLENHI